MNDFQAQDRDPITSAKYLTSQEIDQLFRAGDRSIHQGDFSNAITIFEQLLTIVEPGDYLHLNIQRNLVKAYQQNEQLEQAIALCQLMIDSSNRVASLWGTKFIAILVPNSLSKTITEKQESQESVNLIPSNIQIKFKTLSQFKQYCQDHLLDQLKKLEQKRLETLITIIVSGIICLIVNWAICRVIINYLGIKDILIFYLATISFPSSIWIIFCRGCIHIYRMGFKRNIIEKIISFIDEAGTLSYAYKLFLEDKRQTILSFTRSQIFRDELEEPDSLEQEDCVYGAIGNTDIFFAEIIVENFASRYTNEFGTIDYFGKKQIFHGLFFEAKFVKSFVSRTFILPNLLKNKLPLVNNWRGENIDLEDSEFKQVFQVYGDNQIESRYLLSTNLMSRLVEFNKKAKRQVYISFIDGFMYIAIPYRYPLFEPKLFKNMTSFTPLREYFLDLQLMIGIVDDLNLNRRIWKQ